MTAQGKRKLILALVSIVVTVTAAVFWHIAKQEVYFLCGNFGAGVEQASVIRQLDTANLSSYTQIPTEQGSTIIFSSKVNFKAYTCTIEMDKNKKVLRATFK